MTALVVKKNKNNGVDNMFFFESIPGSTWLMWLAALAGLIIINEITRRSKYLSIFTYIVLPVILTFVLWPKTACEGTTMGDWFHWAKVYSSLAGVVGFMALRYIKGWSDNKYILMFPPAILAINIMEAVIRDFQCSGFNGMHDGMMIIGGSWNIMNGIAGILNIITITGWMGIFVSKKKSKDMLWPDQLWTWIIAYDIWNFAYVYNCLPDRSFYNGAALLLSCTIAAFVIQKGAWLQHRAQTLAIWCMFAMSYPAFADTSQWAVKSSHNPKALFTASFLALLVNVAIFIFYIYKLIKTKRNPLKEEIYTDLKAYKEVVSYK